MSRNVATQRGTARPGGAAEHKQTDDVVLWLFRALIAAIILGTGWRVWQEIEPSFARYGCETIEVAEQPGVVALAMGAIPRVKQNNGCVVLHSGSLEVFLWSENGLASCFELKSRRGRDVQWNRSLSCFVLRGEPNARFGALDGKPANPAIDDDLVPHPATISTTAVLINR